MCFSFQLLIVAFLAQFINVTQYGCKYHTRLLVFLVVFVCYCHARFVRLHIVHVRSRPSPGVIVAGCVASRRCWIGMGTTISASTGVAALACASSGHHTVATQCTVTSCLSSTVTPWQEVILTTWEGPTDEELLSSTPAPPVVPTAVQTPPVAPPVVPTESGRQNKNKIWGGPMRAKASTSSTSTQAPTPAQTPAAASSSSTQAPTPAQTPAAASSFPTLLRLRCDSDTAPTPTQPEQYDWQSQSWQW